MIPMYVEWNELNQNLQRQLLMHIPQVSLSEVSKAVLETSNQYQASESVSPWSEPAFQIAYVHYFHPLNTLRLKAVAERVRELQVGFEFSNIHDYGCGLGAASLALIQYAHNSKIFLYDNCAEPLKILGKTDLFKSAERLLRQVPAPKDQSDLLVLSYSLNELEKLPNWVMEFENVLIVEPSTKLAGRNLLETRNKLITHGYNILAPCTHQGDCPLLTQSKGDWCHDRTEFKASDEFYELDHLLPIKNGTLTYSYLFVSKNLSSKVNSWGRVTGDVLKEKGKTRQLVCSDENRNFLTAMKKDKTELSLKRGDLIESAPAFKQVANELRLLPK
jgi:hypothetical protein